MKYQIDKDIRKANTLPASFYRNPETFEKIKENIFLGSWQLVGESKYLTDKVNTYPFIYLPNFLDEPLLLTRDEEGIIHCLSNVCTHRGNFIVSDQCQSKQLVCRYHGRRFDMRGRFKNMPEFEMAENFPTGEDHLSSFPVYQWGPLIFAGLNPAFSIEKVIQEIRARVDFMALDQLRPMPAQNREYEVKAHWALYCDNYLEGFHIPFVHHGLNEVLDFGKYETELYDHHNLQIGYVDDPKDAFELPTDHPDHGKLIGAYYFWVFPNMMFNFYPWGLSVNIVKPEGMDLTRVSFIPYVHDHSKLSSGAGTELDQVEAEDEEVVESVQLGIKSRFYKQGRFSPTQEKGVHHFHRMLAEYIG